MTQLSPLSILTPPAAGSWNVLLEDHDATVIDARPLGLRVPEIEPVRVPAPEAFLEVALAPYSDSNVVVDLDGRVDGVFAATYRELPLGAHVEVRLCLPGGVELMTRATVRWARAASTGRPGLGLAFARLDAEDADLLQTFAAYREPELFVA
ncbi:MAG: PilZ domain-containing protein [Myxococcota bacterium]|nr:PilZ domain-containing protein [Myxococcota bacterium]